MSVNIFKNNALIKIAQGLKDSVVTITNNLLATKSGTALDAVQGKVLDDKITELNSSLGGFEFYTDEQGKAYYKPMGADSGIPFSGGLLYAFGINNGCSFIKGGNSLGVITEESDNVNVYCPSDDNTAINIPIDVSKMNEIIIIFAVNVNIFIGLSTSVTYSPSMQSTKYSGTSLAKHVIDTSSLTGNYYINISAWGGGKGTIYEILAR